MGIYMVEEIDESNRPEIERRMKQLISYHNLLLWAINDVRVALSTPGYAVNAKIDALAALLPPELAEEADKIVSEEMESYKTASLPITHNPIYRLVGEGGLNDTEFQTKSSLEEYIENRGLRPLMDSGVYTVEVEWRERARTTYQKAIVPRQLDELYRKYAARVLRRLVALLDENGLLREFKREEIGGY